MTRAQMASEISGLDLAIAFARDEEATGQVRRLTHARNRLRAQLEATTPARCEICDGASHGAFACPSDPRDESEERS